MRQIFFGIKIIYDIYNVTLIMKYPQVCGKVKYEHPTMTLLLLALQMQHVIYPMWLGLIY